ncbi:hypothetical protein J437_LFUL018379 [Ladona fulva]|uniref:Uncharacterized protein n=1 Tax=Ladona fulva TaxID=123851 RepID=A0A8K0KQW4_LADFU|nr:hypothetical protein J437_LFUL018379 [Ladona fulva]
MALSCDSPLLLWKQMSRTVMMYEELFTIVGYVYAGKILLSLTITIVRELRVIFRSRFWPIDLVSRYGKWAVVTGSTDGIGKAYAQELARRGLNIFLISRNPEKLKKVADEIELEFGVETKILDVDFSLSRDIYPRIASHLEGIEVGILVNNVGFLNETAMPFSRMCEDDLWKLIKINIAAATMMSKIILPAMIKEKKGAVVNISSVAGMHPLPMIAVYSATKAYLYYFSEALRRECRSSKITIQTLTPGYVNTNLISTSSYLRRGGLSIPRAGKYVRHAIATLGVVDTTCGYWIHELQLWFASLFPRYIISEVCMYLQAFLYKDTKPE